MGGWSMDRWVEHGWVGHGQVGGAWMGGATHCNKGECDTEWVAQTLRENLRMRLVVLFHVLSCPGTCSNFVYVCVCLCVCVCACVCVCVCGGGGGGGGGGRVGCQQEP